MQTSLLVKQFEYIRTSLKGCIELQRKRSEEVSKLFIQQQNIMRCGYAGSRN